MFSVTFPNFWSDEHSRNTCVCGAVLVWMTLPEQSHLALAPKTLGDILLLCQNTFQSWLYTFTTQSAEVCFERQSKRECVRVCVCVCKDVDLVQLGNLFSTSESLCMVGNCNPPQPNPPHSPPHPPPQPTHYSLRAQVSLYGRSML